MKGGHMSQKTVVTFNNLRDARTGEPVTMEVGGYPTLEEQMREIARTAERVARHHKKVIDSGNPNK
jgi:hypothetical protein